MNTYKAIRNSFGYLNKYWKTGETVEAKSLPNKHFELVGEKVAKETKPEQKPNDETADAKEKEIIKKRKYNKRRA
jgi:hypothetical protein